jgi:hypothetical protein
LIILENWDKFPSAEDWDNEEYTGSLADTKVFTPSTQTAQGGPGNDGTNGVGGGGSGPPSSNHIHSASNNSISADVNKVAANQEAGVTLSSVVQGLAGSGGGGGPSGGGGGPPIDRQNIDINLLLQKSQQNSVSAAAASQNAGADLLATLQNSYSGANQGGPVGVPNQGLPQRNRVQKMRGPPSKVSCFP